MKFVNQCFLYNVLIYIICVIPESNSEEIFSKHLQTENFFLNSLKKFDSSLLNNTNSLQAAEVETAVFPSKKKVINKKSRNNQNEFQTNNKKIQDTKSQKNNFLQNIENLKNKKQTENNNNNNNRSCKENPMKSKYKILTKYDRKSRTKAKHDELQFFPFRNIYKKTYKYIADLVTSNSVLKTSQPYLQIQRKILQMFTKSVTDLIETEVERI